MKEIKSTKWLLGSAAFLILIILLIWSFKPTAYTEQVTRGLAVDAVSANLKIEETYRLTIRSESSGRVISSLLKLGNKVQSGDTIIQLDTTELELKIESIQIELEAFRNRLKLGSPLKFKIEEVKDKLEDLEALDETGSASPDTLKARRRQLAELLEKMAREKIDNEANLKRLENELEQDQLTLKRMSIKSPVDGIIVAVDVFEGDLISDRTGIAEIISNERRVIAKISEEDFAKVKLGQRAVVRFLGYGDDLFNGEVIQLLPTNDPETQRFSIFLSVDISKERLTPGLTGEANIIVAERENTLIIPSRALLGDQVYAVKNGKVEIRPVLKGYQGLHNVEVLSGLEEGELVIVEDLDRFKHGNKVKVP